MKTLFKARKGQFLVIAASVVVVILSAAIATVYLRVLDNPFTEPVTISSTVSEINLAIKNVLGFTVSYYNSILEVTGNISYAKEKTMNYIMSGLTNIAHSHVEWNPSFNMKEFETSTQWFEPVGWSIGNLSLTYSIPSIGLEGVNYASSVMLKVEVVDTVDNQSIVNIRKDGNYPDLSLTRENFFFYNYNYNASVWNLVPTDSEPIAFIDGNYSLNIPSGINPTSYFVKVIDNRGITASAFYSPTKRSEYAYTFDWNETLYEDLTDDTIVIELLQNGTLRWLGEKLDLGGGERPIPPLPVKAFHVNQTIDGVGNIEVPFQIEDWASTYRVPLGLTSNSSIFSNNAMIVFLMNHNISKTTVWWDGRDVSTQTPCAWTNIYFQNDNPDNDVLTNGELTLDLSSSIVIASTNGISSRGEFLRINGRKPLYGSALSYTIHHGVVRDIVQQEAEWSGGITDCPNIYSHIVLTLPANATYYTFSLRTIFLPSTQSRDIFDLSLLQIIADQGNALTENGTISGNPIPFSSSSDDEFYYRETVWEHHWSEFIDGNNNGAGVMFRNITNMNLYAFDDIVEEKTGALEVFPSLRSIEMNPVTRFTLNNFQDGMDITWHGAIVTFGSGNEKDTIYPTLGDNGLWVLVESPPIVTIE